MTVRVTRVSKIARSYFRLIRCQVHQRPDGRGSVGTVQGRRREAEPGSPARGADQREALPELLLPDPEGRRLPPHAVHLLQHPLLLGLPPGHDEVLADTLPRAVGEHLGLGGGGRLLGQQDE